MNEKDADFLRAWASVLAEKENADVWDISERLEVTLGLLDCE